MMKKALKILAKILLSIIGFILLYLMAAYCLSSITVQREAGANEEIPIHILTNGVHTDIVVPTRSEQMDWSRNVPFANTQLTDTAYQYLAMGWGDKGFYLETPEWSDLKASVAFNAMFGLGASAMHATYYQQMKEGESCKKIMISKAQYARLIAYINKRFQKDNDGHYLNIKTTANYGKSDAFYEANGRYNLFQTCNTWANNALKACGQKCCLWTAFDTGIFRKYE